MDGGLLDAAGQVVWEYAVSGGAILVTEDEDFAPRLTLEGAGPAVVWLRGVRTFPSASIRVDRMPGPRYDGFTGACAESVENAARAWLRRPPPWRRDRRSQELPSMVRGAHVGVTSCAVASRVSRRRLGDLDRIWTMRMRERMDDAQRFRLVVTIIAEELTPRIVDIIKQTGGQAITVVRGRGRDLVTPATFLGIPIEPERELLFLVLHEDRVDEVVDAIGQAGELHRPGRGLVLVTDLARVEGFVPRGIESTG
jgi:nitrogen regulatory protein P-II 1